MQWLGGFLYEEDACGLSDEVAKGGGGSCDGMNQKRVESRGELKGRKT